MPLPPPIAPAILPTLAMFHLTGTRYRWRALQGFLLDLAVWNRRPFSQFPPTLQRDRNLSRRRLTDCRFHPYPLSGDRSRTRNVWIAAKVDYDHESHSDSASDGERSSPYSFRHRDAEF